MKVRFFVNPGYSDLYTAIRHAQHPGGVKGGLAGWGAPAASLESRISYFGRSFLWRFYLARVVKESRKEAKNAAAALTNSLLNTHLI